MWWLLAACGSGSLFLAAASGTLIPLQGEDVVTYLYVQPRAADVALAGTALALLLTAFYVLGVRLTRSGSETAHEAARAGRWLAPLSFSGLLVLGLAPALPGAGQQAAVAGYFFYDLRWWWLAVLAAAAGTRWATGVGLHSWIARWPRNLTSRARQNALGAIVFGAAIVFACATSSNLRFTGMLHGDEPRYVRYCELWYEGGGLDVSRVSLVSESADRRPNVFGNLAYVPGAIAMNAKALAADVGGAWRHPFAYRWNRATAEDAFVHGIHGGLYQVHQPGVSVVLFPGYLIDRLFMWSGPSEDGKFPAALPATNLMMLLMYGLAGAALFGLLRSALNSDAWAFAFALIGVFSMPAAAFAFQLYPEIPVLVIVLVVTRHLWFSTSTRARTASAMGALAGSMAWFHPRFLLLGLGFIALAWFRKAGAARYAFFAGFAVLLTSLMAYDYHVTGSWLPTALWDATGEGVHFADTSILFNFIGYGIDRTWGTVPHAPILIGAAAGLVVLGRTFSAQALFVAGMCCALTLTAAGHTLSAAGTTPDRLIVAIVPLLMWPVAVLVRRVWHSPVARAVVVILAVMTLDASVRYNLHHEKAVGPMHDASRVGWKLNLAFPVMRGSVWERSTPNFVLFLGVAAALCVLTLLAWRVARQVDLANGRRGAITAAGTVIAMIAVLSAATSANGDWTSRAYLMDRDAARLAAAHALVTTDPCRFCSSSAGLPVSWTHLEPNGASGASLSIDRHGPAVTARVHVESDGEELAFGRYRVDFGDGHVTPWAGVVGDADVAHEYATSGSYVITLDFLRRDGTTRTYRQDVPAGAP